MAAPVFVAANESVWNTATSPKTVSVTTSIGDVLVVCAIAADAATDFGNPPTGGALDYELVLNSGLPNNCRVNEWATICDAATTFNVSLAKTSGTDHWGFTVVQFSGSIGYETDGVSEQCVNGSGAPTMNLITGANNSAVVCCSADWNAGSGARTWNTVNGITPTAGNGLETAYTFDSGAYTIYVAYWDDAGSQGTVTPGLSAPTGQTYMMAALEIYGDTGPSHGGPTNSPSQKQAGWHQHR